MKNERSGVHTSPTMFRNHGIQVAEMLRVIREAAKAENVDPEELRKAWEVHYLRRVGLVTARRWIERHARKMHAANATIQKDSACR